MATRPDHAHRPCAQAMRTGYALSSPWVRSPTETLVFGGSGGIRHNPLLQPCSSTRTIHLQLRFPCHCKFAPFEPRYPQCSASTGSCVPDRGLSNHLLNSFALFNHRSIPLRAHARSDGSVCGLDPQNHHHSAVTPTTPPSPFGPLGPTGPLKVIAATRAGGIHR